MKIDSTLAEVYWQLGLIYTFYYWNWKEAERNFKHAIQINPNSPIMHIDYSRYCHLWDVMRRQSHEAKRAQEFDPFSVLLILWQVAYVYAGQFDKAIEECQMT